jgi:hypothetical protein
MTCWDRWELFVRSFYPKIKRFVFDACFETVFFDKKVTIKEAELLRTAASIIDVPMPPFLVDDI